MAIGDTSIIDEARTSQLVELRNKVSTIDAELVEIHNKNPKNEDEKRASDERWDDLIAERDAVTPKLDELEERAKRIDDIKKSTYRTVQGFPEVTKPVEELYYRDVRNMQWREARDGALRIMEDKDSTRSLSPAQLDALDKVVRDQSKTDLAKRVIVTETPAYRTAFLKMTTTQDGSALLDDEERAALRAYQQYRAQEDAFGTGGGYALPVFIDPSVILTDQELNNPFLQLASTVDVQTNVWKGVSAAGVQWSFGAEMVESTDASITLAQPSVTVYTARGFIPFTLEVAQDWPGFESEMAGLLAKGYDDLLLNKFTNGNGTTEPMGVITALNAQTTTKTTVATPGAFVADDIYKVWKNLGQKYRQRASWLMSVGVIGKIREFGTANVYHATTVTLVEGAMENLFNKPVYENAYMPDFTGTTGAANIAIVGDFSNYKIARRQGIQVELVPQLFGTTHGYPTGMRGWFAYARIGGNVVNNAGFQMLTDT